MTYEVRCTSCPFARTAADLSGAFALEETHLTEAGTDHVVDIVLRR